MELLDLGALQTELALLARLMSTQGSVAPHDSRIKTRHLFVANRHLQSGAQKTSALEPLTDTLAFADSIIPRASCPEVSCQFAFLLGLGSSGLGCRCFMQAMYGIDGIGTGLDVAHD
jgi:hypothetical protein